MPVRGIRCKYIENKTLRLHLIMDRTVQTSLTKIYMLCVKYLNRTEQPCPWCYVLVQDMKHSTINNARTVEETRNALHGHEKKVATADGLRGIPSGYACSMKEEAKKMIDDGFRHPIMPVL